MSKKFFGSAAIKDSGVKPGAAMSPILKVLNSALKNYGIDKEIARYDFVLHWEEIVGKEIASRTKPECIRSKALVVRVVNSAWAQELSFHKEFIIERLKKHIKDTEVVEDVHFYVAPI